MSKKIKILLDSGVFSAWNQKKPLSMNEYVDYIKRNGDWLWHYVNMDQIPGEFGKKRTDKELEDSAKVSYRNLQKMRDKGLDPLPVFHQGESFKWLEKLLKDGHEYIGISTAKDLRVQQQRNWLNEVFTCICDSKGRPLVKTHGFGITKPAWILNYPFYTADSTTWALSAGYGICYIPPRDPMTGKPDYLKLPMRYILSGVQQKSKSQARMQFENFTLHDSPTWIEEYVSNYLRDVAGVSIAEARHNPSARRQAILMYYINLTRHLRNVRFKQHLPKAPIADVKLKLALQQREPGKWPLTITYATHLQTIFTDLLMKCNATTQLLSYFELKDRSDDVLREYVETGLIVRRQVRRKKLTWDDQTYLTQRALKVAERYKEHQNATEGTAGRDQDGGTSTVGKQHNPGTDKPVVHRNARPRVRRSGRDQLSV